MRTILLAAAAAWLGAAAAPAAVVAEGTPYTGTPTWTDIVTSTGVITQLGNGDAQISTGTGGAWFGWGCCYFDPAPAWSIGDNGTGNLARLNAYFSSSSPDWNFYLADGAGYAAMHFNPTGCDGNVRNCRDDSYTPGVELFFGTDVPGGSTSLFVALDTTVNHDYGFLLKGGLVSYFIDGHTYSGKSMSSGNQIFLVGEDSGSTQTGWGNMFIHSVSFDNAPEGNITLDVPEPASWALTVLGFGALGTALRRRKRALSPA